MTLHRGFAPFFVATFRQKQIFATEPMAVRLTMIEAGLDDIAEDLNLFRKIED